MERYLLGVLLIIREFMKEDLSTDQKVETNVPSIFLRLCVHTTYLVQHLTTIINLQYVK